MSKHSLLIVGCGDLGQRLARQLEPADWYICGVRRHPPGEDAADSAIDQWTAADYTLPGSLGFAESMAPDFVMASFTPTSMDVAGYRRGFTDAARNVLRGLGRHSPRLLTMISSTRVYAEQQGGWVDETSPLSTSDERALAIIEAEQQILNSGLASTIVRFGGIYGHTGGRLVKKIASGQIAPAQPVRYTNRIHRDDCAGFLAHLIEMQLRGSPVSSIYNGVDDNPAPAHEVETWIAKALDIRPTAPAATSIQGKRDAGHKRCRNTELHRTGYQLRYPDYRSGYQKR